MAQFDRRSFLQTACAVTGGGIIATEASQPGRAEDRIEWEFDFDDWLFAAPTVVDGTVYVGDGGGTVSAIGAQSGDEQWETEVTGGLVGGPAVADDVVYLGTGAGILYALDADDGAEQWSVNVDGSIWSSPTLAGEMVYFGTDEGTLHAVSTDGEHEWDVDIGPGESDAVVGSSPTFFDNVVYVGGDDGSLYAVDATTGDREWRAELDGEVTSSPTHAGGLVFVGTQGASVYALDAQTGDEEWRTDTTGPVRSSPTVLKGRLAIGEDNVDGENTGLRVLDTTDGSFITGLAYPNNVQAAPTLVNDTVIAVSAGTVRAVDIEGAELKWSVNNQMTLAQSDPIVVDGTVYVGFGRFSDGGGQGTLFAIDADVTGDSNGSRALLGTVGHHDYWATAPGIADLVVTITDTVVEGGEILGTVEIVNVGAATGEDTPVTYVADGAEIDATHHRIAPGETGSIDFNYVLDVDDPPEVEIAFESPTRHDVVTVAVDVGRLDVALDAPETVNVGDAVNVSVTVENSGDLPADGTVDVLMDGETVDSLRVDLPAGESTTETVTWEVTAADDVSLEARSDDDEATATVTVEDDDDGTGATDETGERDDADDADDAADVAADADDDGAGFGFVAGGAGIGGYLAYRYLRDDPDEA